MTNKQATRSGILYIVATPIGNINDITLRAIETLKSVDYIIAEDTRHSKQLLQALGIHKPLSSLHAFNEQEKSASLVELLINGHSLALVSDAGTPLISDPGYPLVKAARAASIPVIPVPGANALITALSAAGVPCDQFTFGGFLPAKKTQRLAFLKDALAISHTLVFYESTHRLIESLSDFAELLGEEADIVIAKELTKVFERFVDGSIEVVTQWFLAEPARQKGEFVIIVPPRKNKDSTQSDHQILSVLLKELPLKQAVKLCAQLTGENRNKLYELALGLQQK